MTMWARSDVCAINISAAHGGCATPGGHRRPVEHGAPVKTWALDCPPCEDHLRKDAGRTVGATWSVTDVEIPETYDETKRRERNEKTGKLDRENQLAGAMIELGKLGSLPEAIAQALASLAGGVPALAGQMVCPDGHAQPAGQKFCGQCAAPMRQPAAKAALPAAGSAAEPSGARAAGQRLPRLRDASKDDLMALARERGLDDAGTRPELIARLGSAGVTNADLSRLLVPA